MAAGEFNAAQHSVKTLVRTPRRGPQSVEGFEFLFQFWVKQRIGREPLRFDIDFQFTGSVVNGFFDGRKSGRVGIVLSENPNVHGFGHVFILKERSSQVPVSQKTYVSLTSAVSRSAAFSLSNVAINAALAAYQTANVRSTAHLGAAPTRRSTKGRKFHVVMC